MKQINRHRAIGLNFKIFACLGLLLIVSFSTFGTETKICNNVTGIWFQPNEKQDSDFNWKAQWIWLDEALDVDVMLARHSFDLSEIPKKALLRISASQKYQLYVNGEYICRGPARSAPHHQSYDIINITDILLKGKNSIAVRVNYQDGKYSYQHDGRAGLLAQLEINNDARKTTYITDEKWKVSPDSAWEKESPRISRFQLVVNDRVDLRRQTKGWHNRGFDDSLWSDATPLMRNVGWPGPPANSKAQSLTPPWTSLVPRDIPYLTETNINAENLTDAFFIESDEMNSLSSYTLSGNIEESLKKGVDSFINKGNPLLISATENNKACVLVFDFGEVKNGMPRLDIKGTAGTTVEVMSAPFIVDDEFSYKIVDSELLDRIILSGERDVWEATCFKPVRYMAVVIRGNREDVVLNSAGIHQLEYPFKEKGYIKSTDEPWIANYSKATSKTIKVCTTDAYTDNYRERRQYAQTGYYAALGNYYLFGDLALQRRYLLQVAQEQNANGIMPAYAPAAGNDYMVILDSNCLWIRSLRNYLLYSGDYETVKELLPAAKKMMELLNGFTNSLGLIDNPPYAYWLDHAVNDRRGANFNLNGHYLGALEDYSEILFWFNEPENATYKEHAELVRKSLQTHLWDTQKQLFADALIDGELSEMFSEHANAMALAMNVATPTQAELIAAKLLIEDKHNYIKRESGITMVTPAVSYFLHKGLCNYGYIDESLNMFRNRFDKMLAANTNGTLWEEWWLDAIGRTGKLQKGRTRSDAQTESAFSTAIFAEYILGFKPLLPGFKEVTIKKPIYTIRNVESVIPSPEGELSIKWGTDNRSGKELSLDIPGEMIVKLDISNLINNSSRPLQVNGKIVKRMSINIKYINLSNGSYKIEF